MVEVFKTNVQKIRDAAKVIQRLAEYLPGHKITFDLADCDKILRVEGERICIVTVIKLLQENDYECAVLD